MTVRLGASAHVVMTLFFVNILYKLTCQPKNALLKNLTVHSIVIILKIYNVNSGFVTGWHYMPSFFCKKKSE